VDGDVKPTYEVKAWQDDNWWLARVVAASDGADPSPLNAVTQARALTRIEQMARDLIATILDMDETTFDVDVTYDLPEDVNDLVGEAKGARAWLDAAQELWQERSAVAARALADKGYSLRETAKLLALSHQRVDQLLEEGKADADRGRVWAMQLKRYLPRGSHSAWTEMQAAFDLDLVVVLHGTDQDPRWSAHSDMQEFRKRIGALMEACAERVVREARTCGDSDDAHRRSIDA
jgi:hypothetical protein